MLKAKLKLLDGPQPYSLRRAYFSQSRAKLLTRDEVRRVAANTCSCRSRHGLSYAMTDELASAETRGLRARMRKNNIPPLIEDRRLVLPKAAEEIEPARLAEQIERAR